MKRKKDYQITEFCHRFLSDYIEEGGVISLCIYSGGGYRIRGEGRSCGLPERTGSEGVARDRVQLL